MLILACCLLFSGVSSASAAVFLGVRPDFPDTVKTGESGEAALVIDNFSFGVEATQPVTVTGISLAPSCGPGFPTEICTSPDPGVFQLSGTATGGGSGCTGVTFTISPADAEGRVQFSPETPIALDVGETCIIDFTFNVLKVPTSDTEPLQPGVQTRQLGRATGTSPIPGTFPVVYSGSGVTTVIQATPTITTQASGPVTLGGQISDTATLSGASNPTGTITFRAFGPDNATCAGAPAFERVIPVAGNGNYTSAPFTPSATGTYRWTASYSGDVNNVSLPADCNEPNESVLVGARPVTGGGGTTPGGRIITGTPGRDTLVGTPGNDTITCGAGDDVVVAGAGNDVINCGAGNDTVDAGLGNDRVDGGSGNDKLTGGPGVDQILGGTGNDVITGNGGKDRASGGGGRDKVGGGSGNDRLGGGGGADRVSGDSGNDSVSGNSGPDRLFGGPGRDTLRGGAGADRLRGGPGKDRLIGGPGKDSSRQ